MPAPRAVANSRALAFSIPRTLQVAPVARGREHERVCGGRSANARTELNARARADAEVKAEAATTSVPKPTVTAQTVTAQPKPTTSKTADTGARDPNHEAGDKVEGHPRHHRAGSRHRRTAGGGARGPYSPDDIVAIIGSIFPADVADKAISVARRESSLNPNAQNCVARGCSRSTPKPTPQRSRHSATPPSQLTDPTVNTIVAYALYQRSGWAPWGL